MAKHATRKLKRKTRKQRKQRGGSFQVRFGGKIIQNPLSVKNFPKNIPQVNFKGLGLYTVIMWDPDAPASSWLHWLVVNAEEGDVKRGEELLSYAPPTPPSGTHTYHIAIYSQKGPLQVEAPAERGYFNHESFIKEYELLEVGHMNFQVGSNSAKIET